VDLKTPIQIKIVSELALPDDEIGCKAPSSKSNPTSTAATALATAITKTTNSWGWFWSRLSSLTGAGGASSADGVDIDSGVGQPSDNRNVRSDSSANSSENIPDAEEDSNEEGRSTREAEAMKKGRENSGTYDGKIVLAMRGKCLFEDKAAVAQSVGAAAVIIANTNVSNSPRIAPWSQLHFDPHNKHLG